MSPGDEALAKDASKTVRSAVTCKYRLLFYLLLIAWAALQAWGHRYTEFYNDGISYLDSAEHFAQGDFVGGFTGYWSPLYPALIACFLKFAPLSGLNEFALLKVVNFILCLTLFAAFEFFFSQFVAYYRREVSGSISDSESLWLSEPQLRFIGYCVFAYSTLVCSGLWIDTPDVLSEIFFLLLVGITLSLRQADQRKRMLSMCAVGFLSALAYFAKAVMLATAVFFLLITLLLRSRFGLNAKHFAATLVCLVLACAPYVACLSSRVGEFTLSTPSKINAIWYVTGDLSVAHGRGTAAEHAALLHPSRVIYEHPTVYEFATPISGTYPPWFDPSYWMAGAKPAQNPIKFFAAIVLNVFYYLLFFFGYYFVVLVGVWLIAGRRATSYSQLRTASIFSHPGCFDSCRLCDLN